VSDAPIEAPTSPPRVGRLTNLRAVRRELARVYVDARQGRIDPRDAARLAFVLSAMAKTLESELIERRIDALEGRLAANPSVGKPALRSVA